MQSGHSRTLIQRQLVHLENLDEVLAELRTPRSDIVVETKNADADTFDLDVGPFHHYRRTIAVEPRGGQVEITQTFAYAIAAPVWWILFHWPVARSLRRPPARGHTPWWAPPTPLDARASMVLAMLCTVSVVAGYLGTVITQTITFAADEFDNSKGAQGNTLAAVRVGIALSMAIVALADRRGRRAFVAYGAIVACGFTVLGAFSINLVTLGITQTVARGITTAVAILLTIVAAEELPAAARAYGLSLLTLIAGLGAGMAVWVLPVADLSVRGWRVVYILPIFAIPALFHVVRQLPETRRFEAAAAAPHGPGITSKRLAILGMSALLVLAFRSPASQLQNEFLRDERGYDGLGITLFTICTSTPIGIGVFIGGRLADRRGRRLVASVAMTLGSLCVVMSFLSHGWAMWAWQLVGVVISAATIPALGVYGPELFGTKARGTANGLVSIAGVGGSLVGLLVASHLSETIGLGKALAILVAGPLIVAALVMIAYPETAGLELEEINPAEHL